MGRYHRMRTDKDTKKKALLKRVEARLLKGMGKVDATNAKRFMEQCFQRVPYEELAAVEPNRLAAIVGGQFGFIRTRKPGRLLVRAFNPTTKRDGWEPDHSVVELVNDDRPFLVDTASLTLSEMGVGIHLALHPLIRVERDRKGVLQAIHPKKSGEGKPESAIQLHIEKHTDADDLARIEERLRTAMADVRKATGDWNAMEQRVVETVDQMPNWAPGVKQHWMDECQAFARWLLEDNFVLLGMRDYEVKKKGRAEVLQVVPGSGLGILCEDGGSKQNKDGIYSRNSIYRK